MTAIFVNIFMYNKKIRTNFLRFTMQMMPNIKAYNWYLLYCDSGFFSGSWEISERQFQIGCERKCGHRTPSVFLDESGCKHILAFPFHQGISSDPAGRKKVKSSLMIVQYHLLLQVETDSRSFLILVEETWELIHDLW